MNGLKSITVMLMIFTMVFAQGGHHSGHNGRPHDMDWPDSLTTVTTSGTVHLDSSMMHTLYFLDIDDDNEDDYQLGLGPWWYEPESGATRPEENQNVSIVGGEIESMTPPMLVVFEIDGLTWRDSTGAPPWSGGWIHQDDADSAWVFCPTDSMSHMGFPPNSMMGMMFPDSMYAQMEEMDWDDMPGDTDSSMFAGYFCGFSAPQGGHMNQQGMMNFNQGIHMQFHYEDDMMDSLLLDESTVMPMFLDTDNQWQPVADYTLDQNANTVMVVSNDVAELYGLSAETFVVSSDPGKLVEIPQTLTVKAGYPNPFNPEVTIRYRIPEDGNLKISILDLTGAHVRTLYQGRASRGQHAIRWNGRNAAGLKVGSGTYLVRVSAGDQTDFVKVTLLK